LNRLLDHNWNISLLANEAILILKALSMLDGEAVGKAIGQSLAHAALAGMGRCLSCDTGEVPRPERLCESCMAEIDAEMDELDSPDDTN